MNEKTKQNGLYKRVLSVMLALAVLLMMTPVWDITAEAAEPEHNHSGWTEWTSKNSLPNSAGSYYLTGSVSGSWTAPSGTVNLCLNGNTISGGITVPSGATLNIYDEGSGKVKSSGKAVEVSSGGKAYINGGTYETSASSGSNAISVVSGGFIQIDNGTINGASQDGNATILIKGECIINNATVSGGSNAVYSQNSGKTYIYGGNFKSTGYNSMAVGTSAYMYINMTNGGVISNDLSGHYAINVLGTAEIDYAITSGSSTAINVNSSASATIKGGSFYSTSSDTVTNKGALTITGGSFTGKKYAINNSGTFNLSGSPTFSDEDADIYLASGKKINITGALNNPTPYSVLTATTPRAGSPVEITNSSTTSYNDKTKFTPVNSSYIVRKNNSDQLELAVPTNPRTVIFDYQDGVTAVKTVTYESGDEYGELPAPTRTGYIFEGWFDEEGNEVTEDTEVTADHTLTAKWEECKHDKITSWTDGGNGKHTADCTCGETVAKDHNWNEGEVTTEPTEEAEGEKTFTCSDCGTTKTETIEKLTPTGGSGGNNDGDGNTGGTPQQPSEETTSPLIPPTGNNTTSTGDTADPSTGDNNDPTGNTATSTGDTSDPSGDTFEPSTGDKPSDGNDTGKVTVNSESGENAPDVSISEETSAKLKEEVIAEHLTPEEKAAVANGDDLDVILVVEDAGDTVPAEDKQVTEAVLTNTEYNIGMYLNIDLIKLINGQQVGKITELNTPIRVTVEIPEELRHANRAFAIIRVHDGAAEILEDVDNDPDTITVVTDKFSTYSIAYQDTEANPDTGMTTPIAITGLACAVIVAAVAVKRKKIIE